MSDGLDTVEAQRNQLLQTRLDQLQEILTVKKFQLKELYQLLKSRDSLGDLLHIPTADKDLAIEKEDAECNAFVELYEHGSINDIADWPAVSEASSKSPPHQPEQSPSLSERVSTASPPAPPEPLASIPQAAPKSPSLISSHSSPSTASPPPSPPSPPSPSPSPTLSTPSPVLPLSPKPATEPPSEETQDMDRSSDLASEAAPRQEIAFPSSPEPSPEPLPEPLPETPIHPDDTVEEKKIESETIGLQYPLPEEITEEASVDSGVIESQSPKPMEEVVTDDDLVREEREVPRDEEHHRESTAPVESAAEAVEEGVPADVDYVAELKHPSPPAPPSEKPMIEELEVIMADGNTDADEEKAVSESVVDVSDLHNSPEREIEPRVSPDIAEPAVSSAEDEPAESLTPLIEESVEKNNEMMEVHVDELKLEVGVVTLENEAESTDVAEKDVSVTEDENTHADVALASPIGPPEDKHDLNAEEMVLDEEHSPALHPVEHRVTEPLPDFHDDVEEGISSPIEDTSVPLLRPMTSIESPEEFDSPTRSPSASLTRSPSIIHELPSPRLSVHDGDDDDDNQLVEDTQETAVETRMTRSRSRALEENFGLEEHRASRSPKLEEQVGSEQPEVHDEYPDKVSGNLIEEREGSLLSQVQDASPSPRTFEEHDIEYNEQSKSSSPVIAEPTAVTQESDVEMEDADVLTTPAREPSLISMDTSIRGSVGHIDVKMEDQSSFHEPLSHVFNFPRLSPRPSQTRSLLLDVVPSTITDIQINLLGPSASLEEANVDEKNNEKVLDVHSLPDTTFPPMPTSPLLTPYVDSIPLPPIEDLPVTLSRKVHPAKLARKREREREKDGKDDSKDKREVSKPNWLPWEISRWNAHFRANPAHKMVKRSGKVLTTRMWGVAYNEAKLVRCLERVERLKQEGRWSFRQPKKQKGPMVSKSHWDWVLDEMKWMRVDFREERIRRTALAFNMAHAVREWHLATPEERKAMCVPRYTPQPKIHDLTMKMETESFAEGQPSELHVNDKPLGTVDLPELEDMDTQIPDGPWQTTEELDPEKEADVIFKRQREQRNLEESKSAGEQGSLDADGEDDADGEMDVDIEEEIEPVIDLTSIPVDGEPSQPTLQPESSQENIVETPLSTETGIKNPSTDRLLTSVPEKLPGTVNSTVVDSVKAHVRASLHTIADDEPFLDVEELCSDLSQLSTVDDYVPLELPELFSDYQVYQALFSSPELAETAALPRTDKKAEKKERKIVEELIRIDETTSSKVVNVSTFMQHRPLLVSALQPSSRLRDGQWEDLEDTVVTSDGTVPVAEPPPDYLFGPQRPRPPGVSTSSLGMRMPKDGQKRFNETPWSNSEDLLLKDIVDRYPNNWGLVADVFNSSRVTISHDQRTAWDCLVRWDVRWNEGKLLTPPLVPTTPEVTVGDLSNPPQTPLHGQAIFNAIMTRKRSAGQMSLTLPSQPAESRKRRRHNHMHEAMKRSAKKREYLMKQMLPNRRVTSTVHETHNAYKQSGYKTPAELSRMKADRDRREYEEQQSRRKQEEDMIRKRQIELRQQQMQSAQPVALPHVRGPGHPQVNISQQAARLPLNAGNLPVPAIAQNTQVPAGVNLSAPNLQRLTPEQQRMVYMQMQARQAQLNQAQAAQAQLQQGQSQVQAQAQVQVQQQGQPSQPQPQIQQSHPPLQQQHPQQQQQQLQAQPLQQQLPNGPVHTNVGSNVGQHAVPGTPAIPAHPIMHQQSSPVLSQAALHHPPVPQISPPRLGTPANVNLMGMGAGPSVRPTVPQLPQQQPQQRPGSTPQIPSIPSQPPRPASTQLPQQPGQMLRPTTLQQHQQQQAAMHHAFMQNMQNGPLSQEQFKRLYHSQVYWGNPQAMHAASAAQMAYAQSAQQQPQTPQQQHTASPRPPSVQSNHNLSSSPAPPS